MYKTLVVDDDIDYLNTLKESIPDNEFDVITCSKGKEAIELQKEIAFDLIITDIIMPDADGLEVIMQIKKSNPSAKIIAITGGGILQSADLLFMAKVLGANYVLQKPFSPSLFKKILFKILMID